MYGKIHESGLTEILLGPVSHSFLCEYPQGTQSRAGAGGLMAQNSLFADMEMTSLSTLS